jgi:N-acetylmuramoyl-L-alanine amidase
LGASVTLTRSRDEYPTLFERMQVADAVRPHFFLSVHHNSVAETADTSLPSGTEIYYHYESGSLLAQRLAQNIANDTGRINRGFYESYYVVTKMSQAPAVLMELGFMPNPVEYERAASPLDMYRTACAVSTALIEAIRGY